MRRSPTAGNRFFGFVFKRAADIRVTAAVYGPIEIAILAVSVIVNCFAFFLFLAYRRQSSSIANVRMNLGFVYITSVDLVLHTFWLVVVSLSANNVAIKIRIFFADSCSFDTKIRRYAARSDSFYAYNSNEQFLLYAAVRRRTRIFAGNSKGFLRQLS